MSKTLIEIEVDELLTLLKGAEEFASVLMANRQLGKNPPEPTTLVWADSVNEQSRAIASACGEHLDETHRLVTMADELSLDVDTHLFEKRNNQPRSVTTIGVYAIAVRAYRRLRKQLDLSVARSPERQRIAHRALQDHSPKRRYGAWIPHAETLLRMDPNITDGAIAEAVRVARSTVRNNREWQHRRGEIELRSRLTVSESEAWDADLSFRCRG